MNKIIIKKTILLLSIILIISCGNKESKKDSSVQKNEKSEPLISNSESKNTKNATNVYWGDTHVHTAISGDAFGSGTRLGAEEAYRLAIGEKIESNTGQIVQLQRPLDFMAVADHAEGFGVFYEIQKGNKTLLADPIAKGWYDLLQKGDEKSNVQLNLEIKDALANSKLPEPITNPETATPILRTAWQDYTKIAEKYNNPGKFTAMIGYEWTSVPGGNNMHRVVLFRDNKDKTDQILPFSAIQSEDPEKLWEFLSNYEEKTGGKVLAIPHNGNLSGGLMFSPNDFEGNPIDADYTAKRAKWEPLYEIMQIKGSGETHPLISTKDEFANYGITGWDNGNLTLDILETPEQRKSQYARKALIDGMIHQKELGSNPYKMGFIASTDGHTGIPTLSEDNFWGKATPNEPSPERLKKVDKEKNGEGRYGWNFLSGGYAAVWATENTREALWDAMKRKETYATSGTRIKLRVFGGYNFSKSDIDNDNYATIGYEKGVAMGGDLSPSEKAPQLMIHAIKDPNWANLDRIQVIKGWIENGVGKEQVYDVAWSDNRKVDKNNKLPAVGNTVNLKDGTYANTIGATELKTIWQDPDFNPNQHAFYYVRVLEIPSPTWQLYDMVKYSIKDVSENVPLTQQERAWSSPIWYTPK